MTSKTASCARGSRACGWAPGIVYHALRDILQGGGGVGMGAGAGEGDAGFGIELFVQVVAS
jgi:kinesin family member 11